MNLSNFVDKHKREFSSKGISPEKAKTEILAKEDGETLREHTNKVLWELKRYMEENDEAFNSFSKRYGDIFEKQKLLDILFFSAYFHDIGKGTLEFYENKISKKIPSSYHPLYGLCILDSVDGFDYEGIDLLALAVLTHHSLIKRDLYEDDKFDKKVSFFDEITDFLGWYNEAYEKFFGMVCSYDFDFDDANKICEPYEKLHTKKFNFLDGGIDEESSLMDNINIYLSSISFVEKNKIKEIYGFLVGNLIRADWLASGDNSINLELKNVDSDRLKEKLKERAEEKGIEFKGLREFQKEACKASEKNVIIKIPTGEGKTEAALFWALNNIKNKHTKIIYTLPTQVTSNSLYERFKKYFGEENVGIVHGSSSLILEKELDEIEDEKKRSKEKKELWKKEIFINTFSKPITVCTLDSMLLQFFNIHKWPLSLLNFENCVVIVDEIHSYDMQMFGAMVRILEELSKQRDCKICIMSATLPETVEKKLKEKSEIDFIDITQNDLFEKKPNEIKISGDNIRNFVTKIIDDFKNGGRVLVVCNTVDKSKEIYRRLKKSGSFDISDKEPYQSNKTNLILYHSQFIKKDRAEKEREITEKEGTKKPLVVVATQVVEISLDIDFDVMYTELAPIDALIQRFGRINRKKQEDKRGRINIFTHLDSCNENKEWSYPYREDIIKDSKGIVKDGTFSLKEYLCWTDLLYNRFYGESAQGTHDFKNKFDEGYKKYEEIVEMYGLFKIDFRESIEEILKILKLRDIGLRFEKRDVIPISLFKKKEDMKYENTVGIYKYWLIELANNDLIEENGKFYVIRQDYDYEQGIKIDFDYTKESTCIP